MKKLYLFLTLLLSVIFILSACGNGDMENQSSEQKTKEVTLMGESENWIANSYQISLTSDVLKAGNGTLDMKGSSEYKTDYFYFEVHAVINGEDTVIQAKKVTGSETDVSQVNTGTIEGDAPLNKDGETIKMDDITDIYLTIEWKDINTDKKVKERIDLSNEY
ncbi:hypothetical protein [Oceanobacillus senegalensis]|uniref:hypothetical protein n=1 Tax=Oceanobacillus senegalensis TaxID=1936063 RepID=UPI000A30A23E|nr:hypothetical protein [Oceanobacillus senegalensis]